MTPHYLVLRKDKTPMWPPRGGVDGNEVYPPTHTRAGKSIAPGTDWQNNSATEEAARYAQESGVVFAGIMPSSINCLVIDIDTDHSSGVQFLKRAVVDSLGEPAYWCETPSGGNHLYYISDISVSNSSWMHAGECGGQIKCKNGYAVLYDWKGFHAFLENIDDYDSVNLESWPINETPDSLLKSSSGLSKDPGGITRFTNEEVLAWLNKNVSPDIDYETWVKIGMGLHHEGYPVAIWDSWSKSGSKYKEGECQTKYDSFGSNSNPVTMATVVKMVNENSVANIKMPEEDESAPHWHKLWGDRGGGGTDRAIRDWCQQENVPLEYSVSSTIEPDIARIMRFNSSRIINIDGSLYSEYLGMWRHIEPKDNKSKLSMASIILQSRKRAEEVIRNHNEELADMLGQAILRSPMSEPIVRNICATVLLYRDSKDIKKITSLNPTKTPVLPLNDGRAINLRDAFDDNMDYKFVTADDMRELYIEDLNFNIPPPLTPWECPEDERGNWNMADEIYNKEGRFYRMIRRISLYSLPGSQKRVDMMAAETNGGKSLLSTALRHALPGAFVKVAKKGFLSSSGSSSSQFTPMHSMLNQHWGVFVDELHDHKITATEANSWGDDTLVIHKKGVDPYVAPNNGTVVILGDEVNLPQVDPSSQGFKSRFKWALDLRNEGQMTSEQYHAVRSVGGASCLLYYFIKYASMQLVGRTFDEAIEFSDAEGDEDLLRFSAELQDPVITAIQDMYELSNLNSKTSSGEIVTELENYAKNLPGGLEVPTIRHLHQKVVSAFDNKAKRGRYLASDGKRVSGYTNLRRKLS